MDGWMDGWMTIYSSLYLLLRCGPGDIGQHVCVDSALCTAERRGGGEVGEGLEQQWHPPERQEAGEKQGGDVNGRGVREGTSR